MTSKPKAQTSMDETRVDDYELEQLLEKREELKQGAADFRAADKAAKEKLNTIEAPSPFRVGRFVIERAPTPAASVSFEKHPGIKTTIKLAGE